MAKIKILCPYCFKHFYNTEVQYQCDNNERNKSGEDHCPKEYNNKFNEHWGGEVETRHVFNRKSGFFSLGGFSAGPQKCDKCGKPSNRYVCPHCNNWLPQDMIINGSEIISVIGGPQSGKTNYIITLIQQLRKYGHKLGLQVTPQQVGRNQMEKTDTLYKKNYEELFENNQIIGKTPELKGRRSIPWIFKLEHQKTKKNIYLVFYDTAGEEFQDAETITHNASYFAESSGVIVILDTLSIKEVNKILKDKNIIPDYKPAAFDKTITTLKFFIDEQNKKKALDKKPTAFVFSKFDVILNNRLDVADISLDCFNENSSFIKSGKFDLKESEEISNAIGCKIDDVNVEGLLSEWDEEQMVSDIASKWGDKHKFFGVSALGSMPHDGIVDEVKPYRVMDPLIWILHKIGGFNIPVKNG